VQTGRSLGSRGEVLCCVKAARAVRGRQLDRLPILNSRHVTVTANRALVATRKTKQCRIHSCKEKNMIHIFSTGQVARLLGVQPYQIEYAHVTGQLAEPGLRFLGKRVYDAEDVGRVAQHFGVQIDEHTVRVDDQKEGE
jgi:hypothetical protein